MFPPLIASALVYLNTYKWLKGGIHHMDYVQGGINRTIYFLLPA
jgi:hypothetical protein